MYTILLSFLHYSPDPPDIDFSMASGSSVSVQEAQSVVGQYDNFFQFNVIA